MATILACAEQAEVDSKDYLYYQSLKPSFIKRHHTLQLVICDQMGAYLAAHPTEVVLLFIRRKQSECWQVARRIRDVWSLPYEPPAIKIIIEFAIDDFDHPSFDRQAYLTDPEYAKLFDTQVPAYFEMDPDYSRLYDSFSRTFDSDHHSIITGVEGLLFGRRLDRDQVAAQIASLFPEATGNWSWTVHRHSYHPIFDLHLPPATADQTVPLVWSWENKIWVVDTWQALQQFISDEQLSLADERDRIDILTIFSHSHHRNIVRQVFPPYSRSGEKRDLLAKYAALVEAPTYRRQGTVHQVRFWAIDENRPEGNLEEWLFVQGGATVEAQAWVREENFRARIKNERGYSCYDLP